MFSLRDTLASVLLGVQIPSNDSPTPSASGAKKGKKKASKKKSKKTKVEVQQQPDEDDENDYESLSDSSEKADDDDEEVFPGMGVNVNQGPSESAKLAATMIYNYESTQLEDQIHVMIRQIAEECNLDKSVVSDTVNSMFESGLQYDNHDEVLKLLKPKMSSGRGVEALTPVAQSVTGPPSTVQSGRNAKTTSSTPAPASVDTDAAAALARFNSAGGGLNHPHHHTRSEHHGLDAKHGREIEATRTHTEPVAASSTAPKTHTDLNVAAPVASAATVSGAVAQQQSMKEKLDYVAAYSRTNLYDSLAALCSWASVSLSPGATDASGSQAGEKEQKMEAFFQSQALEILLTTLFSDDSQQLSRAEVKGAFQALLQHVLLLQTDPQGTTSVHHIIESLTQLVAQVYALRGAQIMPAFASSSARGNQILAQQVAACIRKLYTQLSFNTSGKTSSAESEDSLTGKIDAINAQLLDLEKNGAKKGASAAEAAQEKVQNLFFSREIHADKVQLCIESVRKLNSKPKLSSAAVQRPVSVTSASAADLNKSVNESSSLIEHILLTEFDSSATGSGALSPVSASSLQSKHQHSHHINSTFERVIFERDNKLAVLNNELGSNNLRLQELNAHKQRLLEQVRLCDQEIANVGARVNTLTTELGNTTYFYQQQLDQLVQTGNTVRKSLQAHDQVNNLIGAVRAFESKFAEALLYQHAAAHASAPHTSFVTSNGVAVARNTTVITSSASGMQVKNSAGVTTSNGALGRNATEEARAALAERLEVLTSSVQCYVAAEAQCIQFLAQRVIDAQVKQSAARKELLAYAALMMKGQVVTAAEATVSQLDAEINEDLQAVRQLQQGVADSLAQVRTLDGNSTSRSSSGKSTFNFPASELALIVQSCNSIGVSPAAEIVLLAGKAPAPAPIVQAAVPAVVVAPVPAVARAPRAEKATGKDARAATAGAKPERDGNRRDTKTNKRNGSDVQKSEVDTSSAIQQLERSCLQKPSTGSGAPVKVAAAPLSTRTEPAPRSGVPSAPVNSVWKIPVASSASSDGIQESKSEDRVKSLKDIQEEQQNEKTRMSQRKQNAAVSVAATVVVPPGPTPAEAAEPVAETPLSAVEVAEEVAVNEPPVEVDARVEGKVKDEEAAPVTPSKSAKKKAKSVTPKALVAAVLTTDDAVAAKSVEVDHALEENAVKTENAVFDALPKRSPKKKSKAPTSSLAANVSTAVESVAAEETLEATKVVAETAIETVNEPVTVRVEEIDTITDVENLAEMAAAEVTPQKTSKQSESTNADVASNCGVELTVLDLAVQREDLGQAEASTESKERTPAHADFSAAAEHLMEVTPTKPVSNDNEGHCTPLPSIAAELQTAEDVAADALTPAAESRLHADSFTSPLVEFHHAYKIKEIGIPVIDNDEGDVNPMKGPSSPVVNYLNTYPELEEECDLLIEMEVEEEQGESSEGELVATPSDAGDMLGYSFNSAMMSSANNSVTSKSSVSKMRDINPMARPSPGKGSRVRLDISQVTENDAADSADNTVSASISAAPEEALEEEKSAETEKPKETCEEAVEEEVVQEVSEVDAIEILTAPQTSSKEASDSEFAPTVKSKRFAVFSANQTSAVDTSASDSSCMDTQQTSDDVHSLAVEEEGEGQGHTVRSKRFAVYSGNHAL